MISRSRTSLELLTPAQSDEEALQFASNFIENKAYKALPCDF
jgi:hypothetical protein